jgi:soluble lytic murein transglycosylase
MRPQVAWWVVGFAVLGASCGPPRLGPSSTIEREPSSAWVARARRPSALLTTVRNRPELGDLVLYLEAREAARRGDDVAAVAHVTTLGERYPDSIWLGGARLVAGQVRRAADDLDGADSWLTTARDAVPPKSARWITATLALADVAHLRHDDARALELVRAARAARLDGVAARRARRVTARIRARSPSLFEPNASRLAEAELLLGENDARGAALEAVAVLAARPDPDAHAQALWIRARAERSLGQRADAEVSCLEVASLSATLGPKALAAAARWRWNADDDAGAMRLYRQLATRFPAAPEAAEARYAIGRIQQEAGHYDDAFDVYDRLARELPRASVANEARWRAGWVRYLAGDLPGAAAYFRAIVDDGASSVRTAAAYWHARIRGMLQDPAAETELAALVEEAPATYYGGLAAERLGHVVADATPEVIAPTPPAFPDELDGTHAARARTLASLGLRGLARRELDAIGDDAPRLLVARAYTAIGAPGAALMSARALGPDADDDTRRFLYPLGFWPTIEHEARARGLDPLFVSSLIRQESLFLPDAVSPADAHGLMQLLPRTAREVAPAAGVTPNDVRALHAVSTNVRLGTTLLRRLLDRYGGSHAKALAAYNAGEDAVAKWERRYGVRPDDEFTELISFRETRDYVKIVLQNLQVYRQLYAASPAATSLGSPPNAPFDMMTTTSPGRLVATR